MLETIAKTYDHTDELEVYRFWEERGYFTPAIDPARQPFTIIMPPPNVTGELHIGHALTMIIEDTMVRWHRMLGEPTLWLPGTDHAGIATQVVVERELAEEGLTRHDLGREKFIERVWQSVDRYRKRITYQLRRFGSSCDWTRERFTLDPGPSRAVRTTFVRLYHDGLIYRGERIINWCPRCATALSDLEVEHKETDGYLYYLRYPLEDGSGHIVVATTRPETMLGDTAVAVHPEDDRYRHLVGKRARLPVIGRLLPIIADEAVDPAFGTGAVKVTPAHDPVDFDLAQRHGLERVLIMNLDATINENGGPYAGLDRYEARRRLIQDLKAQGLVEKVEPYRYSIGHCERCDTIVEPIISRQWFVNTKPLAEPALKAVLDGDIRIIPERLSGSMLTGWRTSGTGASPARSGGATGFPFGTVRTADRPRCPPGKTRCGTQTGVRPAVRPASSRTPTSSTPGSARACGPTLPSAGQMRPRTSGISTRQRSWRPATTSSFSGLPGWSCLASATPGKCRSASSTFTAWSGTPRAGR